MRPFNFFLPIEEHISPHFKECKALKLSYSQLPVKFSCKELLHLSIFLWKEFSVPCPAMRELFIFLFSEALCFLFHKDQLFSIRHSIRKIFLFISLVLFSFLCNLSSYGRNFDSFVVVAEFF